MDWNYVGKCYLCMQIKMLWLRKRLEYQLLIFSILISLRTFKNFFTISQRLPTNTISRNPYCLLEKKINMNSSYRKYIFIIKISKQTNKSKRSNCRENICVSAERVQLFKSTIEIDFLFKIYFWFFSWFFLQSVRINVNFLVLYPMF